MSKSRGKSRTANTAPKKRFTAITAIVLVVLLLFIAALFVNSKFIRRQITAVEANGMKLSAAEYQFFYVSAVSEYTNYVNTTFGEGGASLLPVSGQSLESQTNPMTNQTWAVFYDEATMENIQFHTGAYQAALAAGFTVSDEEYAKIDEEIDLMSEQISMYYGMTFAEYIDYQFGASSGITEGLYRELSKKQYYVSLYAQSVNDAFSYSEAELDTYYAEHSDEFDVFKYRFFTVRADTLDVTDFESVEAYEEADKAAIDAARALAVDYVATITDEQDFIEKAREYNETTYEKDASTLYHISGKDLTTTFADWAKDSSRALGNMCTEPTNEDASANRAFYVVYFLERINNEYPTVNVQLMLLTGQTISSADFMDEDGVLDEDTYNTELENSNSMLGVKAKELFAEWEANGSTLDYLTEYYETNPSVIYGSLDEYTATISGSLYEHIYYSYIRNDEADAWMHDPARQVGDITVVQGTNDGTWFLMYFMGQDMNYSDYLADVAKRAEAFAAWEASFLTTEAKTRWGMKLL